MLIYSGSVEQKDLGGLQPSKNSTLNLVNKKSSWIALCQHQKVHVLKWNAGGLNKYTYIFYIKDLSN